MEPHPSEWVGRLTAVHDALARAHDSRAFLQAVAGALAPFAPDYIDLAYVDLDDAGRPAIFEVVQSWRRGEIDDEAPIVGGRFAIADFPIAQMMLRTADAPQLLPDIGSEPELAQVMTMVGRNVASAVILPLFSARHTRWQGVVGAYWDARRAIDAAEGQLYGLLMRAFSETLASKRTQRALQESLSHNEALLRASEANLRATEAQKATLRVVLDNLPLGVAVVNGATGERELVNRRGVALLGSRDDVADEIGATQSFVYFPGETEPTPPGLLPHARTLATGETHSAELEFEREAGQRSLFFVTSSLLRYPGDPAARVVMLYQDITDVRRGERERLQAQEEALRAQALALSERSTPLIPIRDDVLVMPLIGTIDPERGGRIVEALVGLGGRNGVRVAILDVTGVPELDVAAASTLLDAARGLRLRGVQPILTGVRPAVAATLVGLGVDLSDLRVYATLQDAVSRTVR